jgi:hypothetical protein
MQVTLVIQFKNYYVTGHIVCIPRFNRMLLVRLDGVKSVCLKNIKKQNNFCQKSRKVFFLNPPRKPKNRKIPKYRISPLNERLKVCILASGPVYLFSGFYCFPLFIITSLSLIAIEVISLALFPPATHANQVS